MVVISYLMIFLYRNFPMYENKGEKESRNYKDYECGTLQMYDTCHSKSMCQHKYGHTI